MERRLLPLCDCFVTKCNAGLFVFGTIGVMALTLSGLPAAKEAYFFMDWVAPFAPENHLFMVRTAEIALFAVDIPPEFDFVDRRVWLLCWRIY